MLRSGELPRTAANNSTPSAEYNVAVLAPDLWLIVLSVSAREVFFVRFSALISQHGKEVRLRTLKKKILEVYWLGSPSRRNSENGERR